MVVLWSTGDVVLRGPTIPGGSSHTSSVVWTSSSRASYLLQQVLVLIVFRRRNLPPGTCFQPSSSTHLWLSTLQDSESISFSTAMEVWDSWESWECSTSVNNWSISYSIHSNTICSLLPLLLHPATHLFNHSTPSAKELFVGPAWEASDTSGEIHLSSAGLLSSWRPLIWLGQWLQQLQRNELCGAATLQLKLMLILD